ncbi:hypothetical protein A6U96_13320 [Agrobacterium tumefaciens]|nr:hypothetical protein A6U96_13320 [Agrobacterium tumefaciens]
MSGVEFRTGLTLLSFLFGERACVAQPQKPVFSALRNAPIPVPGYDTDDVRSFRGRKMADMTLLAFAVAAII